MSAFAGIPERRSPRASEWMRGAMRSGRAASDPSAGTRSPCRRRGAS
ncbi:hypothetical protein ACFPRL_23320 [Pseudoclavibacter helvolus]